MGRHKNNSTEEVKEEEITEPGSDKEYEKMMSILNKKFGDGILFSLGDNRVRNEVEAISTGLCSLDIALGVMGIPRGRNTTIFGRESSGKTALVIRIISTLQRMIPNARIALVDAEWSLDKAWCIKNGVNPDEILISQPNSAEEALEVLESLVETGIFDFIAVDSVAALVPQKELDGDVGDSHMGLQGRLLSQFFRRVNPTIAKSKTAVMWISQIRSNLSGYGPPDMMVGGNALRFYSSIMMEIKKKSGSEVKEGDSILGQDSTILVRKNKLAPPLKTCDITMLYSGGFSGAFSLLDAAVDMRLVQKSGAWYSYKEQNIGQGRVNTALALEQNREMSQEIYNEIYRIIRG